MSEPTSEKYGKKVRWLREGLRISGRDLCRQVAITPSYLSDIEHGRRLPSPEVSDRIADALRVDRDALYELAVAERVAAWPDREVQLVAAVLNPRHIRTALISANDEGAG